MGSRHTIPIIDMIYDQNGNILDLPLRGRIKKNCYATSDIFTGGYLTNYDKGNGDGKFVGNTHSIKKGREIKILEILNVDYTGMGRFKRKFKCKLEGIEIIIYIFLSMN